MRNVGAKVEPAAPNICIHRHQRFCRYVAIETTLKPKSASNPGIIKESLMANTAVGHQGQHDALASGSGHERKELPS